MRLQATQNDGLPHGYSAKQGKNLSSQPHKKAGKSYKPIVITRGKIPAGPPQKKRVAIEATCCILLAPVA